VPASPTLRCAPSRQSVEARLVEALVRVRAAYPRAVASLLPQGGWFARSGCPIGPQRAAARRGVAAIRAGSPRHRAVGLWGVFAPDGEYRERFFSDRGSMHRGAGKAPGVLPSDRASSHPYICQYQGKTRDVMTLAHELGHGVHRCWHTEWRPDAPTRSPWRDRGVSAKC